MLLQGLYFKVILSFNLDGLRWSSGGVSRDLVLQLGHMEDIVDLLEPALQVKFVCRLSYVLYYLEWCYIPRPKLLGTCKMESLRRQ